MFARPLALVVCLLGLLSQVNGTSHSTHLPLDLISYLISGSCHLDPHAQLPNNMVQELDGPTHVEQRVGRPEPVPDLPW